MQHAFSARFNVELKSRVCILDRKDIFQSSMPLQQFTYKLEQQDDQF